MAPQGGGVCWHPAGEEPGREVEVEEEESRQGPTLKPPSRKTPAAPNLLQLDPLLVETEALFHLKNCSEHRTGPLEPVQSRGTLQTKNLPHLRQQRVHSLPAVHVQNSQPELPPGRDPNSAT